MVDRSARIALHPSVPVLKLPNRLVRTLGILLELPPLGLDGPDLRLVVPDLLALALAYGLLSTPGCLLHVQARLNRCI